MTTIRLQLLVESLQIIITHLNFETFVLFQVDKNWFPLAGMKNLFQSTSLLDKKAA